MSLGIHSVRIELLAGSTFTDGEVAAQTIQRALNMPVLWVHNGTVYEPSGRLAEPQTVLITRAAYTAALHSLSFLKTFTGDERVTAMCKHAVGLLERKGV